MKDLHIKLDYAAEAELEELCKYIKCKQTTLIHTLLDIAFNAAHTQLQLSNKYPDSLPENLSPEYAYKLMHITEIFDRIYPEVEEL